MNVSKTYIETSMKEPERLAKELKEEWLWSVKDVQSDVVLHTGRNSEEKDKAIEDAFDFWHEGASMTCEEIFGHSAPSTAEKEEILNSVGLRVFPHVRVIE